MGSEYVEALEYKCELQGELIKRMEENKKLMEGLIEKYKNLISLMGRRETVREQYIKDLEKELSERVG